MSDTDSFIDEVNEEVRRDRLYQVLRRYGWIAVLAILLIVGGAAWNEYQKAQARAQAEAFGDNMLSALSLEAPEARLEALGAIEPPSAEAAAVLDMLRAAEAVETGNEAEAVAILDALSVRSEVPALYRDVAQFKSLTLQSGETSTDERRLSLEALAQPGRPLSLLAAEQLALLDIEAGDRDAAITRYQSILSDASATPDLQQRALQVIVALGGEPDLDGAVGFSDDTLPATDN